MKIIDGKKIADKIKGNIVKQTYQLASSASDRRPNLAIILVGERADSQLYVSLKEKEGVKLGIDTNLYKFPADADPQALLETIDFLNKDDMIDGILVQLPLPDKFDTDKIVQSIDPAKDADGFHPRHPDYIVSPVIAAVTEILQAIKFAKAGAKACVLCNSEIFGVGLRTILEKSGIATDVILVGDFSRLDKTASEYKWQEIKKASLVADILITALGLPKFVSKEIVKPDAVVIDIGITRVGQQVFGDIDFDSVKEVAGFITPVPGGVGPLTIALLFRNILAMYEYRQSR